MWHRVDNGVPPGLHRHIAVAQPGQTDSYRDITVVNLSNTRLYRHDRGFFFFFLEKVSRFIMVYLGEAILIHIHNICFYEEKSKIINCIIFISTPDYPYFYYMLGGNLGYLLCRDVSVMHALIRSLKNASSRSTSTSGTFFFLRICHSNISDSVLSF